MLDRLPPYVAGEKRKRAIAIATSLYHYGRPPVGCERALEQRESRFRSACACCLFRKSRLFAADFLDRLRPGSDLRCCSSLFEVSLSAAELFEIGRASCRERVEVWVVVVCC